VAASSEQARYGEPDRQESSEEPQTARQRADWWIARTDRFVAEKREKGEGSEGWAKSTGWVLARFPTDIWPKIRVRPVPYLAADVTAGHFRALKESPIYAPKTRSQYLRALRNYLRWDGRKDFADETALWRYEAKPTANGRRWIQQDQLIALWGVCEDDYDRLIVAAEGWNGLRRVELLRMSKRDLKLVFPRPAMNVLGKGKNGGKPREVPVSGRLYGVLVGLSEGKAPADRMYPFERSDVDRRLEALRQRAGIPVRVSSHDLRRSFGRIAYYVGTSMVDLQNLYGHESPDITAHYIGIDLGRMAEGLDLFEQAMETTPRKAIVGV
jgi:integrase